MDHLTFLCALALSVSLSGLAFYHASLASEARELLRETSRFPLFAARDRLVSLIASGQMSEDEAAWRNAYRGVNSLLGLHQSLHLIDLLSRYAKHVSLLETDARYRQQFQTLLNVEREAARRVPAFASASESIDEAFAYLVRRRTRAVHVFAALAVVGAAIVIRTMVTAGLHVAGIVFSAIWRPEEIGARYFGVQAR